MVAINTYGYYIFELGTFPDWAKARAGSKMGIGMMNATTPAAVAALEVNNTLSNFLF
jgi:hypothetical protein